LVGREAETAAVRRIARESDGRGWSAVLEGEAGIGKTAIWRSLLDDLTEEGNLVLTCRPGQAEATHAFAGLTDLLAPVPDEAFAALPVPMATALEVATLRASPAAGGIDEGSIGIGLSKLFQTLAADRPVVVAVDDVQWLDEPSTQALASALRRSMLEGPVALVATLRTPVVAQPPLLEGVHRLELPRAEVTVGPLSIDDLHHVIRAALGETLPRPALGQIAETSGGNAFYAIELARAFDRESGRAPLPRSLQQVVGDRLSALSDAARRTALFVALEARPTVALLRAAGASDGLAEAETAKVLAVSKRGVDFSHPLLAQSIVESTSAPERRQAHAVLARCIDEPEAHARHLALASVSADDDVASALDAAVASARARGATAAAAELCGLALDHTVDSGSSAAMVRRVSLADLKWVAGDADGSAALYHEVLDTSTDPATRAQAAVEVAPILYQRGKRNAALSLCHTAIIDAAAAGEPALGALAHLSLASLGEDPVLNTRAANDLLATAPEADPRIRGWAMCQEVAIRFDSGDGLDVDLLNGALAAERHGRVWSCLDHVASTRAVYLKFADEYDAALEAFNELRDRAIEEGYDGQLPYIVGHLPMLHLWRGNWEAARKTAAEHLALAETTGQEGQLWQAHLNAAEIAFHHGNLERARAAVDAMLEASGDELSAAAPIADGLRGAIALDLGDIPVAVEHLERWWETRRTGAGDPGTSRHHGDLVAALVANGDLERARSFIDDASAAVARSGRASVLALLARGRALLAAAEGDLDGAFEAVDEAMAFHDAAPTPFERARTMLVKGQLCRRAKQKLLARDALTEALVTFTSLGASRWQERAGAELARVNIRPSAPLELTPTERRVAELAARGMTNKDIASIAFLSPKTVEANLSRVYRKLGIGSRAELGTRLASQETE
jgi:DNA-binding CsgD family transcriptional regulator